MRIICYAIFVVFSLITYYSFSHEEDKSLSEKFRWIRGTYEYENFIKKRYTVWKWKSDTLKGRCFDIENKDTIIKEEIDLTKGRDNFFYYSSSDIKQNQGRPMTFRLIKSDSIMYIFENLEFDFPEQIIFFREGKDLRVSLQGKDVTRTVEFILRKIR
jgi:hypothetical protein